MRARAWHIEDWGDISVMREFARRGVCNVVALASYCTKILAPLVFFLLESHRVVGLD